MVGELPHKEQSKINSYLMFIILSAQNQINSLIQEKHYSPNKFPSAIASDISLL